METSYCRKCKHQFSSWYARSSLTLVRQVAYLFSRILWWVFSDLTRPKGTGVTTRFPRNSWEEGEQFQQQTWNPSWPIGSYCHDRRSSCQLCLDWIQHTSHPADLALYFENHSLRATHLVKPGPSYSEVVHCRQRCYPAGNSSEWKEGKCPNFGLFQRDYHSKDHHSARYLYNPMDPCQFLWLTVRNYWNTELCHRLTGAL